MSCVAIIRALLAANAALTAAVPASQIYSGPVPNGTALPAIGVVEIVTTEVPHIDGTAPTTIVDGHAEITVAAADYPTLKAVLALARKACNYKSGAIAGFTVIQIRRMSNGPDFIDVASEVCFQSITFSVLYHEPNT